jgi:hypothetical protein
MPERLTNDEISEAEERAAGWLDGPHYGSIVTRETALGEEHMAMDVLALAHEVKEARGTHLELDDYEAANLAWLLKVVKALGLDSGDWHNQISRKLAARGCGTPPVEPNYDTGSTVRQLGASCIPIEKLVARLQDVLKSRP